TSAPEAANRAATARPIPLLPPVTIAARRKRLISIASSQTRVSAVPHSKASDTGSNWQQDRADPTGSLVQAPSNTTHFGGQLRFEPKANISLSARFAIRPYQSRPKSYRAISPRHEMQELKASDVHSP